MSDAPPESTPSIKRASQPPPVEYRWAKGQSGNPGGRPKGLAARARELTRDGRDILEFYRDVLSGKIKSTVRDRIEAAKRLEERGFGKSVDTVLTGELGAEGTRSLLADLTGEEIQEILVNLRKTG